MKLITFRFSDNFELYFIVIEYINMSTPCQRGAIGWYKTINYKSLLKRDERKTMPLYEY